MINYWLYPACLKVSYSVGEGGTYKRKISNKQLWLTYKKIREN